MYINDNQKYTTSEEFVTKVIIELYRNADHNCAS